jgi:hypothetical protein
MKSMSIEIFSKLLKFRLNEIYLMRSINKYILIMSKKDDKKIELESKVVNIYKEEQPTSYPLGDLDKFKSNNNMYNFRHYSC